MQGEPALQLLKPIAFGDFNSNNLCQGFGLKVLNRTQTGETIFKMKTETGLVSDSIVDSAAGEDEHGLYEALNENTEKVAKRLSGGQPEHFNRMLNHLNLTQKLLLAMRKEHDLSQPDEVFQKNYLETLPKQDMTQIVYWDTPTLNKIDSQILRD